MHLYKVKHGGILETKKSMFDTHEHTFFLWGKGNPSHQGGVPLNLNIGAVLGQNSGKIIIW